MTKQPRCGIRPSSGQIPLLCGQSRAVLDPTTTIAAVGTAGLIYGAKKPRPARPREKFLRPNQICISAVNARYCMISHRMRDDYVSMLCAVMHYTLQSYTYILFVYISIGF
jgi:hypothetical protein